MKNPLPTINGWIAHAWQAINGKKTVIGALCGTAGTVIIGAAKPIPAIPVLMPVAPYLLGAGAIITAVGVLHKAIKSGNAQAIQTAAQEVVAVIPAAPTKPITGFAPPV